MKMRKGGIFFLMLSLVSSMTLAAISVQVDPPKIQLGQTFHLILSTEDIQINEMPNLTPLEVDFSILGTEQRMSYTFSNGKAHSLSQWLILLTAKKAGVLVIPPLQVGVLKSSPTQVEVTVSQASSGSNTQNIPDKEVLFKTEVNQKTSYINQQVLYSVKLYSSQRLLDMEYHPPIVDDALLMQLGEVRRSQIMEHGRHYVVQEQLYAVYPQKSGPLTIRGPSLSAILYGGVPKRIHVKANDIHLNIKPAPLQNKPWLPASNVTLSESYDKDEKNLTQNSTLIRTITLQAAGVPASFLPSLSLESTPFFKVYPEKPETLNLLSNQNIVGESTIKVTYLFNQPGAVRIPALELSWFNTVTGREEVATLPPRELMIDATTANHTVEAQPSRSSSVPTPEPVSNVKKLQKTPFLNYLQGGWWLALAMAFVWLMTLALWWFSLRGSAHKRRLILQELHHACQHNKPARAREAIMKWAELTWPQVVFLNLEDITKKLDDIEFKKQLRDLSEALYSSKNKRLWQGNELWHSVERYRRNKPRGYRKQKDNNLPPMNPE